MRKIIVAFLRQKPKPGPAHQVGFGEEEQRSGRIKAACRCWSSAMYATTAAALMLCLSLPVIAATPTGARTELRFIYTPAEPSFFVSAYVEKLPGNQNRLTITVTELYPDGTENVITATFMVMNNAADTYQVGRYRVYIDVKGNIQIRACEVVGTP